MATFSSPPTHAGNLYASPFYGQDEIIIPHHGGGCKREFEIIKRRPAIGRVSFLFDKLDFLKPLGSSDFLCLDEAEIVAFEVANAAKELVFRFRHRLAMFDLEFDKFQRCNHVGNLKQLVPFWSDSLRKFNVKPWSGSECRTQHVGHWRLTTIVVNLETAEFWMRTN
jgi:hypothetical protein